ncbi:hypothetical protein LSUE1_G008288, partial [Lachnellula suecica]
LRMEQTDTIMCEDEELLCHLLWSNMRGFHDLRSTEAETFNNILDSFLPKQVLHWNCDESGWTFEFDDLVLSVTSSAIDPLQVFATSFSMPRKYIDPSRRSLRRILGTPLDSRSDMITFAMILLQLAEEAAMQIQDWKTGKIPEASSREAKSRGWNVNEVRNYNCIYENTKGVDISTLDESGNEILGSSIKQICDNIPDQYRILHVEPVFRADLVNRFRKRQRQMREELLTLSYAQLRRCVDVRAIKPGSYRDTRPELADEICKPRVTFHGTQRRLVSSIVRHGFIKPGEKAGTEAVEMRCGSSFGVGIYASPHAEFSLMYASMSDGSQQKTKPEDLPGMRLVVCAVLMGRALQVTREQTRRTTDIADPTAHSHVCPNGYEYIVFEAPQIIPCYVIHLDLGAEEARKTLLRASNEPSNWTKTAKTSNGSQGALLPGELEEIKQAKQAAASKWFLYGYGPAKGTSFVILEIGETSDDEEDYGDYQGQRQEIENEFQEWDDKGQSSSWFDEYQTSRTTFKGVKTHLMDDEEIQEVRERK